ncbi:hydrolase [Actinorhabdospora filicis]|uniref:Hydrolase n=1 Tax=Actinorhabdospora filicis TaxID=1785913 RepID=A0A9W6ST13_9ACTN|nr:HAD-IIB family hydrolase [Actinorhabdospora filicis]GLZ81302.1 hydrolase [Actinorhabdospora filicis]
MRTPKLVATDMDGTVLLPDETTSPRTKAALARLNDLGVPLVGITGRGPRLLAMSHAEIPQAAYLVMGQGAQVFHLNGNGPERLLGASLGGTVLADVVSTLEDEVGPLELVVEGLEDSPLVADPVPNDWPWRIQLNPVTRAEALATPALKAFVRSRTAHIDVVYTAAKRLIPPSTCMLTEAGIGYVELCPPGHDKGTGLAFVAERLGVAAEDVLVFGDARNDLPMFAWAGRSVAMGNAHPEVKAAATDHTESNLEDGVARFLEKIFG